ncbi:MAG: acyl-CoA dehydrogenase [Ramlibacter sp.]|nr:acyl-CoA dehydrogenase [Ramlibacter sp.]
MTEKMDTDYNAMSDESFRTMVREFIEANYPQDLRFQIGQVPHEVTKPWYQKLAKRGWVAPGWPREYGGMGLNPTKRIIFNDVFDAHGCARYADNGVMMAGPLLIGFGTPEQRDRFLPKILNGEEVWCQGYSEPNSGSDLASLRTEAVWNGDGWTINGQKIWTSRADQADYCHMLVRTDKNTNKPQDGISYFLVPLKVPGVTIRPINILSMKDDFCEVFFDNVKVPADALVGELNKGWSLVKALMGGERLFLGAAAQSFNALKLLRQIAKAVGQWGEPAFMDRYGRLAADFADHNSLYEAGLEKVRAGGELGLEGAMLKVHQTELYKRIASFAVEIAGPYSGVSEPNAGVGGLLAAATFLASQAGTIYGGSSEVQRNILAKQALHLP